VGKYPHFECLLLSFPCLTPTCRLWKGIGNFEKDRVIRVATVLQLELIYFSLPTPTGPILNELLPVGSHLRLHADYHNLMTIFGAVEAVIRYKRRC